MARARIRRFRMLFTGAAVLAAGCAGGTVAGHYTVSGIAPFYAGGGDYDPGRAVGLDRDMLADAGGFSEAAYHANLDGARDDSLGAGYPAAPF